MEGEYLIFEKYAKGSSFNSKFTKYINAETLFTSENKYIEGLSALNEHNEYVKKINSNHLCIKNDVVEKYGNIYNPYYFKYNIDGLEYRFLVFFVNTKNLEEYYDKKNEVPELDFLITLCDYDTKYKNGGFESVSETEKKNKKNKNIKDIITTVINPNSDPTDPIEQQPKFAKLQLYEYQKKSIKWMLTRELDKKHISLNQREIVLGNIIIDMYGRKVLKNDDREILEFNGGALIDEVGLGKTYQTITMSLCNPQKNQKYLWGSDEEIHTKATLVICPNQLVGQWIREIENVLENDSNVKVIPMFTKIHLNKYTYKELLEADFVITSSTFLNNKCFYDLFMEEIHTSKTYFSDEKKYNYKEVENVLTKLKQNLRKNLQEKEKDTLKEKNVNLLLLFWHRIIVDEFHEVYCVGKYKYLENLLKHFRGKYKWCLSGTPFDKSDDSLNGMLNFVTNYKNLKDTDIWTNDSIIEHMKKYFFRRNTKQSVADENKLLPLKENIVWLTFSKTEWMMYNAYLANPNIDKFNVTLRQLCCHPKIAEELKAVISNCKSLEDIEKVMVKHYENSVIIANKKLKLSQCRLKCLYRKLEIAEWKQYARCLRKMGYRVKFELDDNESDKAEKELKDLMKEIGDDEIHNFALDDMDDDLKDDEETKENKKKKLIIASNNNKNTILNIISSELIEKSAQRLFVEENIENTKGKINILTKDYEGKKSTYDYYNNVMSRLKKTTEIEKVDDTDSESDSDSEEKETCGICLGDITGHDLGVTKCGHIFCFNCVKPYIDSKNKCPMCQKTASSSEIYMVEKKIPELEKSKEFKDKQSLISMVGTKLANLIFFLKKNDKHVIIFSQWDDLLKRVGDVLDEYGIKNIFCKGNVWQRDKAIREFNTNDNIKVIMLSSESAASGTNLTKAEMVILLDPVYGTYEYRRNTEWQAIGRAYRTGQTKQVQVVRFIVKDTVEEKIYNLNKKADEDEKIKNPNVDKIFETKAEAIELEQDELEELVTESKINQETKKKKIEKKAVKKVVKKKKLEDSSDSENSDDKKSESDSNSDSDGGNKYVKKIKKVSKK
jgi:SNF2 family DNA or RNA helicase